MCKFNREKNPARIFPLTEFIRTLAAELAAAGRRGSAQAYRSLAASLSAFCTPFRPGRSYVAAYAAWLDTRGVCRNTSSYYMRLLRTALNKAAARRLIAGRPGDWFRGVYTGYDRTRKRAIDIDSMRRIAACPLAAGSALAVARDVFMFSFYARGMAFVDVALLTRANLRGTHIVYRRRKTGREMRVELHDKMRAIIKRYATADCPYLLPLLSADIPDPYTQYRHALGRYNMRLKQLARAAGIAAGLSSYTARHSWATIARDNDVPIKIISEGMGHDSELTTRIYLASVADREVDRANRRMAALI